MKLKERDFNTLVAGDWAPWFEAMTASVPSYSFSTLSGSWVLLVFLGSTSATVSKSALASLAAERSIFDGRKVRLFCVTADPRDFDKFHDQRGWRWILDQDLNVSRLYGAVPRSATAGERFGYYPRAILLDPQLRVHAMTKLNGIANLLQMIRRLPDPGEHAGIELHAPILVIPRVLETRLCRHLIGLYEGGAKIPSGVMREREGRTVHELDDSFKRRRDHIIDECDVIDVLLKRIRRRLVPAIERAFQFAATHVERQLVACYESGEGGVFHPHRDNTTRGTAHRRFAVSINLNDDFEGGELAFPEFGDRCYKTPAGTAVVFGCGLLHRVMPVTSGRRFAYLPFLFDTVAAEIRQANRCLVDS